MIYSTQPESCVESIARLCELFTGADALLLRERVVEIVNDSTCEVEKRRLAHEVVQLRQCVALLLAPDTL